MSLAITYRPSTFDEVVGNDLTIKSIKAVFTKEREDIQHSWLFTGPSGCGKTTLARLVAQELGCNGSDFTEVDSADFRGIDTIRDMRQRMMYKPMEGSSCRVWLLDEVHQCSKDAQSALLKALEDAPPHVYFILATTDPEKLLPTVRGRCATFEVQPIDQSDMVDFLVEVVRAERKRVPADVVKQIARDSMGSPRNALQILDKIIDLKTEDMKEAAIQTAAKENQVIDLCRALMNREGWPKVAAILKGLEKEDAEKIRLAVMGYSASVMLNGKDADKAYMILDAFREPSFNNGKSQLAWAAYTALMA